MMLRKFSCIAECSDCCIYREYYPSIEYGKIGVLILPDEKEKIEMYADELGLEIMILPRLGIGRNRSRDGPETIIAYQLMGKTFDGNVCPFLEKESLERSPHGGFKCTIYDKKPLACSAYPVNAEDKKTVTLDSKCKFCREENNDLARSSQAYKYDLGKEVQALRKIQKVIHVDGLTDVWRYATGVGEREYVDQFYPRGWILQKDL